MKTPHVVGLVVVAIAVTAAIQEARIANLRAAAEPAAAPARAAATESSATLVPDATVPRQPTRSSDRSVPPADAPAEGEESFGKTVRKMWDNPAGKAMMNQGVKVAVAMMYEDLLDGLELTREEEDYFKSLLGQGIADQQEIGMKMMSATAEERAELAKEIQKRATENENAIKTFLNSDEDFARFTDYKDRLPERQQLDGIRAAFAAREVPIDTETEGRLIDAMYQARTTAGTPDFTGPDAFTKMAEGNLVETFEKSWDAQESVLMNEADDILDETQLSALKEYREQLKEMQRMSMKMAEKMMEEDE